VYLWNKKRIMKWIIFTWYNCNESCFFCSAEVHARKHINRSFVDIVHDIERAKSQGITEIEFIWGEVLIRPDILLILSYAKKKNFTTLSLETNGTQLSDIKFCEKILSLGLNKITLSIHGASPDINDIHTGLKGSFALKYSWLQNLEQLSDQYTFSLATNYVMTDKNIQDIPAFVQLMDHFSVIEKYIFAFVRPLQSYKKLYKYYLPKMIDIKERFESLPIHPKILIQYLPLCILDEKIRDMYQWDFGKGKKLHTEKSNSVDEKINLETAIQDEMTYIKWCDTCSLRTQCRGIWTEYVDFYQIQSLPIV
jgi:MoaA/NifB/PqqE/SkfB family radical SAM enzyme